jgi:hypothetical protein
MGEKEKIEGENLLIVIGYVVVVCCFAASHLLFPLYGSGVVWQGPISSP